MMATAIQKNGMKSLPNGAVNHLVMEHQYLIKESQVQPQTKTEDQQMQNEALQTHNESEVKCEEQEPEPEIDIVINNVVCSFSVRCHLNLRQIALSGVNVEYRREHGVSCNLGYTTLKLSCYVCEPCWIFFVRKS